MDTLIFKCVAGSQLYGTATPESDIDIRGVELEDNRYILGLENKEHTVIQSNEDRTIYTLKFFAKLLLENNPNIVELLYVDVFDNNVYYRNEWLQFVQVARLYAMSQKIRQTFAGYALSQLKKINTHYRWMSGEPPQEPHAEDYGRVATLGGEKWTDYQLKQEYDTAKKHYDQYIHWLKNRNPKRHALEEKYGYDTKNAMNLVRLLYEAQTLLAFGNLVFPLPYAGFLTEVKQGYFKYDDLIAHANDRLDFIQNMKSDLPKTPNYNKINDMVMKLYWEHVCHS